MSDIRITPATEQDAPVILEMIRGLAEYERLSHVVVATEEQLRLTLFGERPGAEVLLAHWDGEPIGFALFFPNYSTFLAQLGIYLEDLFVKPHARGKGLASRSSSNWPGSRWNAAVAGWNGRCSTGMNHPSSFIRSWARCLWMSGRHSGSRASR